MDTMSAALVNPTPTTALGPEQSTEGPTATPQIPRWLAHPPMDWKPPDFFFFLFWARTISCRSGSTSEVHSEVGKVGSGLPGPSWGGGTERQQNSRHHQTTGGREGGCPVPSLPPIPASDSPARSHDFSAKGLSFDWARTGQKGREWGLKTDCLRFNPNSVTYQL